MEPPINVLRERLDYCILTGKFWWKYAPGQPREWNTKFAGKEALTALSNGYRAGRLTHNKVRYQIRAHRAAWAHFYGYWPDDTVDHINHNRSDNCIGNLRSATSHDQNLNLSMDRRNQTGHAGVHWRERSQGWEAVIRFHQENIYLGYFKCYEDAVAARKRAEIYYGFHPNHGT